MSDILSVQDLKKYFPVRKGILRRQVGTLKAVDGISFSIGPGEVVGMVGESGCGKSTAGRAAIRLLEPTEGSITCCGENLLSLNRSALRGFRRNVQMVFQDPLSSLNPRKTISENIGEPMLFHGLVKKPSQIGDRVVAVLERIGLSASALHQYPHQFSGGQQQRICIGRAIALNPKLLVCDEAVSALDVSVQAQILNLLRDLKASTQIGLLFISHDLSVVRHICDRVLVLYLGKIVESAPTEELFSHPKHPYTQALLSAIPKDHPDEEKQRTLLQGSLPSPLNPPSGCPFHPRCPIAKPHCAQQPPPKQGDHAHAYHCIY